MGLKDLSEPELKEFVTDPNAFLRIAGNYEKVFDLNENQLADRIKRIESDLGIPHKNILERIEDAK